MENKRDDDVARDRRRTKAFKNPFANKPGELQLTVPQAAGGHSPSGSIQDEPDTGRQGQGQGATMRQATIIPIKNPRLARQSRNTWKQAINIDFSRMCNDNRLWRVVAAALNAFLYWVNRLPRAVFRGYVVVDTSSGTAFQAGAVC